MSEFNNAFSWFFTRLFLVVFSITMIYTISEMFSHGGPKAPSSVSSVSGWVALLFLAVVVSVGMSFVTGFIVAFPGAMILDTLWKRMQSDSRQLRLYERALSQYKLEHATWLKTQASWWGRLPAQRFELEIADFFRKQGHRVQWTGRSGDGGVDIRLTKQDGTRVVVQCKAHGKPISPGAVRDLYGTLLHQKADEGWLMSRSGFTKGAKTFAADKPIRLLDLHHILPGL